MNEMFAWNREMTRGDVIQFLVHDEKFKNVLREGVRCKVIFHLEKKIEENLKQNFF